MAAIETSKTIASCNSQRPKKNAVGYDQHLSDMIKIKLLIRCQSFVAATYSPEVEVHIAAIAEGRVVIGSSMAGSTASGRPIREVLLHCASKTTGAGNR
jgi:hypothetical protein